MLDEEAQLAKEKNLKTFFDSRCGKRIFYSIQDTYL